MFTRTMVAAAAALALLSGCASTSPQAPFNDVARTVEARSGHTMRWSRADDDDADIAAAVDRLLQRELTAASAVEIALLESPKLRAKLEELSISQADLVQAGLLKNPGLTLGRTAWEDEHISPNLFASVEQDFLDLVTMPLRKRVAEAELEATKLEVADHVLALAAEVREAFYSAQAAEQILAMRRLVEEAAATSAELARRQHEAGNMNDLALGSERALAAQTSLDRKRAEGEAAVSRERLNKSMGLWGRRTAWKMATKLPPLPANEPSLSELEAVAVEQRLDLAAARRSVQAMAYALDLAKTTRWVGSVSIGIEGGRLRHNRALGIGGSVTLEIPLFDQRQAQIAKLEAFVKQGELEVTALAVDVRADVRAAQARVTTARGVAEELTKVLVPLREGIVRESQAHYDAMLLGVYTLVQAKQAELDAYRESIEALRDYWIARSDLERVVGGRVGAPPAPLAESPRAAAAAAPAHVHGETP